MDSCEILSFRHKFWISLLEVKISMAFGLVKIFELLTFIMKKIASFAKNWLLIFPTLQSTAWNLQIGKNNIIQYNSIQYNSIQYNTIQYNTIQYNYMSNLQCVFCFRNKWDLWKYNTIPSAFPTLRQDWFSKGVVSQTLQN